MLVLDLFEPAYLPLSVSAKASDIFVDLQPLKHPDESVPGELLSLFFD